MPMELYKELAVELDAKSHGIGVMCPVPALRDKFEEFDNPTPLDSKICWEMKIIKSSQKVYRKRSMTELFFCMLRAGH